MIRSVSCGRITRMYLYVCDVYVMGGADSMWWWWCAVGVITEVVVALSLSRQSYFYFA